MSATEERASWVGAVRALAGERGLRYEEVGGLNPRDAPAALCPGGSNRITGELAGGFWGSACDADEVEAGRFFSKTVLPQAVLTKSHMPDLAAVVPAFDVESIESTPDEYLRRQTAHKVEFESIDFNRRFLATVPSEYDPIALRELFSPGFLDWVTTVDREVDFGINDRQLWFMWHLRERSREELERALTAAGELFERLRRELVEHGLATYPPGPWNAGLERFPSAPQPASEQSGGRAPGPGGQSS